MPAKVISVAAHKGGVGKTVSVMALGAALARAGKRTLIVDCDPQGHSGMGLGIAPEEGEPTLRELFSEPPTPIKRLIRATHIPGLSLLPSTIRLARTAQYLYGRPKREVLLKRGLDQVRDEFDFIVIDLPPSLGVLTECGIAAADLVVIPCQMEARATDGLVDLLEVVEIIKGEDFTEWRILLTRVDSRKSTTNQAVMAALEPWHDKIFQTAIPQSEPLNQAQIERTDIFSFDPKSKGALAYEAFTQEILTLYGN